MLQEERRRIGDSQGQGGGSQVWRQCWEQGKKPLTCSHWGKAGHSNENCFVLHPEKRSGSSSREKTLEAEIAELKKKLSASASLGHVADVRAPERRPCSSSAMDAYLYGASGEVVAAVATRA